MQVPGIKKYYIGFLVLMFVAIGSLAYAFSQAGAAKTDKKTNDAIVKISEKLDSYIAEKGNVPESLAAAGLTDVPASIKYTKLDVDRYKVCINYQTASSGFDAGWFSLLGGGFGLNSILNNSGSTDRSYFDASVQYRHQKGDNCQTVKTYASSSNFQSDTSLKPIATNKGVYASCADYSTTYPYRRTAKIQSVDRAGQTINLDSTYTQNLEDGSGQVSNPTQASTLKYGSNTIFYDASCQKVDVSSLKTGEQADFFVTSAGNGENTDLVELVAQ